MSQFRTMVLLHMAMPDAPVHMLSLILALIPISLDMQNSWNSKTGLTSPPTGVCMTTDGSAKTAKSGRVSIRLRRT
ncbi:hypothetical protein LshimejAT787_0503910 [Lyophyllum shimeji]|uniref:Uncharacterized protein n=1 Tax=Lyophyllum shimeji TaxID=47721 RepID=A0A9P3PMS3_LYOSH|nr:hypothetical protein LshimejAT787_0503910 [Lyophyllum shimeji]